MMSGMKYREVVGWWKEVERDREREREAEEDE
jgi:hypothetical protein